MKKWLLLCLTPLLLLSACSILASPDDEPFSAEFTIRPPESLTEVFFDIPVPSETTQLEQTLPTHTSVTPVTEIPDVNTLPLQDLRDLMTQAMFDDSADASAALWTNQIRYTLVGSFTQEDQTALSDMASDLVQISAFPGLRETDADSANVVVQFTDASAASSRFERASDGVIVSGEVTIPAAASPAERKAMLQEKMFRLFGFPNAVQTSLDSVLAQHPASYMTEADLIVLETVYQQMTPGMDKAACTRAFTQYFLQTPSE